MGRRQPEKVAERHKCACGAQAVDRFDGRWLCRECLCPDPTEDEMCLIRYEACFSQSNLCREMGIPRTTHKRATNRIGCVHGETFKIPSFSDSPIAKLKFLRKIMEAAENTNPRALRLIKEIMDIEELSDDEYNHACAIDRSMTINRRGELVYRD